jgi:hypothetical protein
MADIKMSKKVNLKPINLEENTLATQTTARDLTEVVAVGSLEVITESSVDGKPKKFRVRGHFGNCDEATANKRVYPKTLWEREITRLTAPMTEKTLYGELDHPQDGRTMLARVSHVITGMKIENGKVIGEAEIVPTTAGKNLQALLESGCKVGISSRGFGSTKPGPKGEDIVQEDYKLVTFDFVADPAAGAFPNVFIESLGHSVGSKQLTLDQLKEANPTLVAEIVKQAVESKEAEIRKTLTESVVTEASAAVQNAKDALRDEFAQELSIVIAECKSELREEVKQELMSDPEIGAAKTTLESIKMLLAPYILPQDVSTVVESKKAEIAALTESADETVTEYEAKLDDANSQIQAMAETLRTVGYKYYLETLISQYPEAELIRKMVGSVDDYDSSDEIKLKVEALMADLDQKQQDQESKAQAKAQSKIDQETKAALAEAAQAKKEHAEVFAKLEKAAGLLEGMSDKVSGLEKQLQDAESQAKKSQIKFYAEQKLTKHPKASKIREVLETVEFNTVSEVDKFFEKFQGQVSAAPTETLEETRARVRAKVSGGRTVTPLDEETVSRERTSPLANLIGISPSEFRNLAKLDGNK